VVSSLVWRLNFLINALDHHAAEAAPAGGTACRGKTARKIESLPAVLTSSNVETISCGAITSAGAAISELIWACAAGLGSAGPGWGWRIELGARLDGLFRMW